jgi:ribosomal protein S8
MADAMQEMLEEVKNAQSMTNEEILKKNSELVGKAKDLIYQKGDSVLDKNKGRLALLDAAVKYSNDDILEELLNNEQ